MFTDEPPRIVEYTDLRRILKTLGVPTSELPAELEQSQIEWRV